MQVPLCEILFKLFVWLVVLITSPFWLPYYLKWIPPSKNDILAVIENGILEGDLLRAISPLDLPLHILCGILHEDCRIWIRFRHLRLPFLQPEHHVMSHDDRFLFSLSVLSRQHVHLSLIHSQLAYVCLQKEYIIALHAGVEQLSHWLDISLL